MLQYFKIFKAFGMFILITIFSFFSATLANAQEGISNTMVSWSPDGKRLALYANWGGDYEIYIINSDGTGLHQLTDNDVYDGFPVFSADGTGIIYSSRVEADFDIYFVSIEGGMPKKLFGEASFNETWPFITKDGNIVFISRSTDPEATGGSNIHLWNSSSGEVSVLVESDATDTFGKFDSENNKIVFSSNRSGKLEIYISDGDGNNLKQLTDVSDNPEKFGSAYPNLTPDGKSVVYWGDGGGSFMHDHHHQIMNLETREITVLPKRVMSMAFPNLSPDGTQIAYVASLGFESTFRVYLMDVDGANHRQIFPQK